MQRIPALHYAPSPLGGRGVFTADDVPTDCLLEICPVLVIPADQRAAIHTSVLHDYYFVWGADHNQAAIALGFGSLYNHSDTPNVAFLPDYDHLTIDFISLRPLRAGEELLVDYRGEGPQRAELWFDLHPKTPTS